MRFRARLGALCLLPGLAGCGSDSAKEQFNHEVVPILESTCLASTCHGVLPDAEARGESVDFSFFFVRIRQDGRVLDREQAYERTKSRINTRERGEFSTLLRKPLAVEAGGEPHYGAADFASTDDRRYRRLLAWIRREADGGEGKSRGALTDNQQLFANTVLPHLATRQCMNEACHGTVAPFTNFEQPMPIGGQLEFPTDAIEKNYDRARIHLHLGGDPLLSRLIRKAVPLEEGGVIHRGGNDIFFDGSDSPAVKAIAAWADAERDAAVGSIPQLQGYVFVRGPVAPQQPFAQDSFNPGSDLWVLQPPTPGGALRNLTASAHSQAPADVRDPAVSHDGQRVTFAMRRGQNDAHNIYEIGVDGGGLRQLTDDALELPGGGRAANVQPTYGPDGRIFFVSTRSGQLADGFDQLDSEIWAVDPESGALERLTHNPSPEVTPSFIGVGKSYGTLAFTMRRTIGGRFEAPVFRMPLDHNRQFHGDPELHIHHGITRADSIVYAMRTLPDGRFVCVLIDRNNVWRGGQLAVFDRQFGPEIPRGAESEAAVGGFQHAFHILSSDSPGSRFPLGGFYRHPVPLPDGRLLVTRSASPVSLDDAKAQPELGLRLVTLEESRQDGGPRVTAEVTLLDEVGVAEYDAEPIVIRPLEDDPSHAHDWDRERQDQTGIFSHRHVQTLEAIFANLEQRGAKHFRDDLTYARFVEALPITPNGLASAPVGLGPNVAARVLDELPLEGNSLYARVPADRPFRLQLLNADRMAVGTQHNRWIHVAPGEKFPGGVAPGLFPTLCSGCHGALSGDPGDVGGPLPDLISTASITMATHENLNPRRPRSPVDVGLSPLSVDFVKDVRPLISRSCLGSQCHSTASAAAGLDLSETPTANFDVGYEALLQSGSGSGGGFALVDAKTPSARQSYLMERVSGREFGASRKLDGTCPGAPPLSPDELRTLSRWIDLGAAYRVGGQP